jgi:hypothetical protein
MDQELITRWQKLIVQGNSPQQAEQILLREFARKYGAKKVMHFTRSLRTEIVQPVPTTKPPNPIFEGCDENNEGIVADPISREEIPVELLFSFVESGKKYCFNISTLAEYVRRSRPENPLTRRPLSSKVVEALQEYEERERFVVSGVTTPGEIFPLVLEVRHFKGEALGELIINVYRVLSEASGNQLSSIDALTQYTVHAIGLGELEVVINGKVKLVVEDRNDYNWRNRASYYIGLWNFCEKRFSLQSFAGAAVDAFREVLLDIPFIDTVDYLNEKFGESNHFVGSEKGLSRYITSFSDYFRSNRDLFGEGAAIEYHSVEPLPLYLDFENYPLGLKYAYSLFSTILMSALSNKQ